MSATTRRATRPSWWWMCIALPRKVTTLALADQVVIHELSTAVGGYPVQAVNTTGLLYLVRYTPPAPATARLPKRVDLDLASRPAVPYAVPLGVDQRGRPRWESLLRLLNVLVGGAPGGGKSGLLNAWLAALTQAHPPGELRLSLIDPKGVELHGWRGLPHVLGPVAETPEEARRTLELLRDEIEPAQAAVPGGRRRAAWRGTTNWRPKLRCRCTWSSLTSSPT